MSKFVVGDLVAFDPTNPLGMSKKALKRWTEYTFIVEDVLGSGHVKIHCNEDSYGHFSSLPSEYLALLQREPLTEEDIL